MRIPPSSLLDKLKQGLAPLYHVFGSELLLVEEALDKIRKQARQQGFNEHIRYHLEPGFDWNRLLIDSRSTSLFSEKQLFEMRMPTGKPGEQGAKALIQYADSISGDNTTLVLVSGKIEKQTQASKWFKRIETAGAVVECAPIPAARLPNWIGQRMKAKGLQFDVAATERLSYFVEGNLLAAAQEIDLLALRFPAQTITAETVENAIADQAQFTIYAFVDACLAGSPHRCIRILQGLRQNHAEPVLILWAMAREIRSLCHLSSGLAAGVNPRTLFQQHGVWSSRSRLVNTILQRLSLPHLLNLLKSLARTDLMLKGRAPMQRQNIWEEIEIIALRTCGLRLP